jgi:predicted nucleic acid-binding protein
VSRLTVLYDACVLYPAPLRDLLMHLALTGLFRAKWSDEIHEEWIRNVLRDRPVLRREQLERTRDLMNAHVQDCLVTEYAELIPTLPLPDPDDRHVLAAAIRAEADAIVTFNLKHFPEVLTAEHGIEVLHPDEFIVQLLEFTAPVVCAAARRHRQSLKNPPKTAGEYLASLERQGLTRTVTMLGQFADLI